MAGEGWTVKDLMEALKHFPAQAKVYYEMGPNVPERSERRDTSRSGETKRWECCWKNSEAWSQETKSQHALQTIAAIARTKGPQA
jgi:hypothetical protein